MVENNSSARVVVVHHHIFKNAGTSFNYALEQAFGEQFFTYDLPNSRVVTSKDLAAYIKKHNTAVVISGHHIALPTPQLPLVKTLSSIIVRRPLSRIRSIYKFEQQQEAQTEGAIMAKKLCFRDFVLWRLEKTPHVFCEYQTLYCSRTTDVMTVCSPTAEDLKLAIRNLENCFVLGTVERYEEFLMMAQHKLGLYFPNILLRNSHLNVTAEPQFSEERMSIEESLTKELGVTLVEELIGRNQLDEQLYQYVHAQIDSWLQKEGAANSL